MAEITHDNISVHDYNYRVSLKKWGFVFFYLAKYFDNKYRHMIPFLNQGSKLGVFECKWGHLSVCESV